jgi:iron-sulfur cluster assembly protein
MSVVLTEKAASEVIRAKESAKYGEDYFLRVGIKAGGCSGFGYSFGFDKEFDEKIDDRINFHGVDVVVDRKSALYLEGTVIDFHEGLDRRGFTFENPNAKKSCGCGSSFQA